MALNLKQLEALVWAADLGSFSKAAERMNTTQPNISIRIRALESYLKVTLLERDPGSVKLTAKGKELTEHARGVLAGVETMISAAGDPSLRTDTLRLGVTELIVHTWLQQMLKAVRERFPNLQIELTVDQSVNLTQELINRNIDLALQNGPFDQSMSGNQTLDTYALTWVAAPELGLPTDTNMTTDQLIRHPILTHARDTILFKELSNHFQESSKHNARLVPSSNLAACLFMAINAMGVATLPRMMVRDALKRGDIVELSYGWVPVSLTFFARFSKKKSPQYVAQIAELAQQVAKQYRLDVVQ